MLNGPEDNTEEDTLEFGGGKKRGVRDYNQIKDEIIVEQIIEKSLVLRNITDLVTVRKAFNEVFNSSDYGEGGFSVNF